MSVMPHPWALGRGAGQLLTVLILLRRREIPAHNCRCPERCFPLPDLTPEESDDCATPRQFPPKSHLPDGNNPPFSPLFTPRDRNPHHRSCPHPGAIPGVYWLSVQNRE